MAFVTDNKDEILAIIDGWRGKFSDTLLCKKLQVELGLKKPPSRHTLTKHDEIKIAIDLKREELRNKKSLAIDDAKQLIERGSKLSVLLESLTDEESTITELIKVAERIEKENDRLSSENKRLATQNDILLERFARWQHNLQKMDGVDMNKLFMTIDNGLPAKNRD
jgi:hypothetical protein